MKSEERDYLRHEKLNEGKEEEVICEEIETLEQSQIQFKKLNRELKKKDTIIKNKDKQIEKLQQHNFKLLPETRNEQKVSEIKNSKNGLATVLELNRIMNLINMEKRIGLNDLTKTCRMKTKVMKGALNFLMNHNFIREFEVPGKKGLYLELKDGK